MFNDNKLQPLLEKYPQSTFWVAYSGGLDSHVLLHSLSHLLPNTRFRALHVNHGWHRDAEKWANTCQQVCTDLSIYCEIITVDAHAKKGESPEAYAREVRYAAMAQRLPPGDCLLTAHHRDDQAETLFLQLLRGAGVRGLASMPASMPFAKGVHLRPLLTFTRRELLHYAKEKQLTWIEDSNNSNPRFSRNFIRHQVLPLLRQRWPEVGKTLARVAENTAEAQHLIESLAYEDYLKVQGSSENILIISHLLQLTPARQRNCLRHWLNRLNFPLPSQRQLEQIEFLLKSKKNAKPLVNWDKVQIRRYRDFLYALVLKKEKDLSYFPVFWDLTTPILLPSLGVLRVNRIMGQGISCKKLKMSAVTINLRETGKRFHSQGRIGSHPLKKLFQEWNIPPWQRQSIPLIYYQEEIIAVVGYGVNPHFLAAVDEWGYVISLKPIT